MAPCITSTRDLYYLAEEFGGENFEDEGFISTIFVYVDAESHAYFGQVAKRKLLMTLEEFRTALEPIPDEDIFPAVSDGTEAYEPPEDSNAIGTLYIKRPLLKAYHDYKQSGCVDMIAENLMDEITALQHIAQHDPHPNIVRFHGCQINRGRITGIILERHEYSLGDFLNLEKHDLQEHALRMKEQKAAQSNQQVPNSERKSLGQEGQIPRPEEQAPTPEEQNPSEQTPVPEEKAVGPKENVPGMKKLSLDQEEVPPAERVPEPDEQALGPEERPQAGKPPHTEEQSPKEQAPDVGAPAPNRRVGLDKEAFLSGLESALSHLHRIGLAHNDVNPSNVMLHRETGAPVLIDFGSCRRIGERLGVTGGTDGWMEGDISEYTHSKASHDLYALAKMRVLLEEREDKLGGMRNFGIERRELTPQATGSK